MNRLTRLIYVSRVAQATLPDLAAVLEQVLRVSRANNARVGVTGMLLTHAGFFLQALEGSDLAVRHTLERVSRDPRHSALQVLGTDFCTSRAFGRWAMCANDLSATDAQIIGVLGGRGPFRPYDLQASAALRLLKTIADIQGRQTQAA